MFILLLVIALSGLLNEPLPLCGCHLLQHAFELIVTLGDFLNLAPLHK